MAEIIEASRNLRLDMSGEALIQQNAPTMFGILKNIASSTDEDKRKHAVPRREIMSLVRLWDCIRTTLEEEEDPFLRRAMEEHLRTLGDVIPLQFLKQKKIRQAPHEDSSSSGEDGTLATGDEGESQATGSATRGDVDPVAKETSAGNGAAAPTNNVTAPTSAVETIVGAGASSEAPSGVNASAVEDQTQGGEVDGAEVGSPGGGNIPRALLINVNAPPRVGAAPSEGFPPTINDGVPLHHVTPSPRTLETRRKVAETFDSFWPGGEV